MAREPRSKLPQEVARALSRAKVAATETVVLGLSGGADSVALLYALSCLRERFGYRIVAAHLNHGIRAEEADRDEQFVRVLCQRLGVELVVERAEGLSRTTPNLEERARQARLEFLRGVADRVEANFIALAHQADDQAETVLLRLLRGAGATGLAAMAERGPGRIIRPLLGIERQRIVTYLEEVGASYVSDSTNVPQWNLRSRLRGELIPLIESRYAPGFRRRLASLAGEMRSVDDLLCKLGAQELDRRLSADGSFELAGFSSLHPAVAAATLRALICLRAGSLRRICRSHVEAVRTLATHGPPNGCVDLPGGLRAQRAYGNLKIMRGWEPKQEPLQASIDLNARRFVETCGYRFESRIVGRDEAALPTSRWEAVFDLDEVVRVPGGLVVRNFEEGDRIRPVGLHGSRKVKDVFIDHKVARVLRRSFPLVVLGASVAWIPGLVRGEAALITAETRKVVELGARQIAPG